MEERMKGPVSFQISRSVPFISMLVFLVVVVIGFGLALLLPGSLPPIIGDIFQGGDDNEEVTEVADALQVTATPSVTQSPPTQTSIPTPTLTPTPSPTFTATPTPKILTWEEFLRFAGGVSYRQDIGFIEQPYKGVFRVVDNGYYYYDGEEWSDTYPCPSASCIIYYGEVYETWLHGYEEHPQLGYWCEYICQGLYRGFANPWGSVYGAFQLYKEWYGDPDGEFFCPQFVGEFEDSSCSTPVPTPTKIPEQLPEWPNGWPEDVRKEVVEKYLSEVISEGFVPYPNSYYYWGWEQRNIDSLSDHQICVTIANYHYHTGFNQYEPDDTSKDAYLRDNYRLELRVLLNRDLGQPKGDNPPLCPGFLEMISPFGLPDFPYTDRE